jgi:hypothetical protein
MKAMPRRQSNVNQADVQRIIRAHKREKVPFRVTLQPNGAAVFEPAVEREEHNPTTEVNEWDSVK